MKFKNKTIHKLVADVINQVAKNPFDVYGASQEELEREYLMELQGSYIRTVIDILRLYPEPSRNINILEIGPYQGIVSIVLSKLGYKVQVFDIPEILSNKKIQDTYNLNGISFCAGNLEDTNLPFENNYFDAIIICEVIEHLNFTPISAMKEMYRVNKNNGYLYVGMPNQLRFGNRVRAFLGYSIMPPISELVRLSKDPTFKVGLHWREYTMDETVELLQHPGYNIYKKYFYLDRYNLDFNFKNLLKLFFNSICDSLKPNLVVIGKK